MTFCCIFISGASSTGKTTLARILVKKTRLKFIEEVARDIMRDKNWSRESLADKTSLLQLQEEIVKRYITLFDQSFSNYESFISDRSIFDALTYIEIHFGSSTRESIQKKYRVDEYITKIRQYAQIFTIEPSEMLLKDDGVRLLGTLDESKAFNRKLGQIASGFGMEIITIMDPDLIRRRNFVLRTMKDKFDY